MPDPIAWRVVVSSMQNLTTDDRVYRRVSNALTADERVSLQSTNLDTSIGVLSATVMVASGRQGFAAQQAVDAFYAALADAGFSVDRPGWQLLLDLEPLFAEEADDA